MSESLVLKKLNRSLAVKSLGDLVRVKNEENVWLMIDGSGSMGCEMRNGKTRMEGLQEVVNDINSERESSVPMVAFGSSRHASVEIVTKVPSPGYSTPLTESLHYARVELHAGRLVVISDGRPNNPRTALDAARSFGGRIDVVYVGDPDSQGELFMRELARVTGGTEFHGDLSEPKKLGAKIIGLLEAGEEDD